MAHVASVECGLWGSDRCRRICNASRRMGTKYSACFVTPKTTRKTTSTANFCKDRNFQHSKLEDERMKLARLRTESPACEEKRKMSRRISISVQHYQKSKKN